MQSVEQHSLTSLAECFQTTTARPVNVIGVVTDVLSPRETRTKGSLAIILVYIIPTLTLVEWMQTFTILDYELALIGTAYNGMKVRFFTKSEKHLPQINAVGDIVILHQVKVS